MLGRERWLTLLCGGGRVGACICRFAELPTAARCLALCVIIVIGDAAQRVSAAEAARKNAPIRSLARFEVERNGGL
jgi:hypothetical protein